MFIQRATTISNHLLVLILLLRGSTGRSSDRKVLHSLGVTLQDLNHIWPKTINTFTNLILCYIYIRHKMCHYTVPSLKEGISWFTLTSSNETKLMLTKLKCLSHWKNGQFHYSVFALFSSFGFSVFICSLSFLSLCSNIVKRPDISCRPFSIYSS